MELTTMMGLLGSGLVLTAQIFGARPSCSS